MDDPNVDPAELRKCHDLLHRLQRVTGCLRAPLRCLKRFSRNWSPGQTIRIVDFATGSAAIPRVILDWAQQQRHDVRITGIERNPRTVAAAIASAPPDSRLQIVQADVLEMPLATGSFDYAIASGFLHHLDDDQAVAVMRMMNRVATRGIIISDPLRCRRLYFTSWSLFTMTSPMFRHDVLASIRQAFTRREIMELRDRAGLTYAAYYWQFGHRFLLAGEKNQKI